MVPAKLATMPVGIAMRINLSMSSGAALRMLRSSSGRANHKTAIEIDAMTATKTIADLSKPPTDAPRALK